MSFSAYATILSSSQGQTIVFQHETTDVGNGYNPSTGIYTAPRTGRYVFTYTIATNSALTNNYYSLIVNNITSRPANMMWLYEQHDGYNRGTNTVILVLNAGDQVFIKIQQQSPSSSSLMCYESNSYNACTFSAFMLN